MDSENVSDNICCAVDDVTCNNIVQAMLRCNINMFAVDFDDTLISVNTSTWRKSSKKMSSKWDELGGKIQPLFRSLLPACKNAKIYVAIVTFNEEVETIEAFLLREIPDIADFFVVVGNNKKWDYAGKGAMNGKQRHMAVAAELLFERFKVNITRNSTLLLDDCSENIRIALSNYVRAIMFQATRVESTIEDLVNLV